jgi:hypothetical protein
MPRSALVGLLAGGALIGSLGPAPARPTQRPLDPFTHATPPLTGGALHYAAATSIAPPQSSGAAPAAIAARLNFLAAPQPFNPFAGLDLTSAQRAQIKALTFRTRAAQRSILARQAKAKGPSKDDFAQLKQLADAHNAAIRALLTPIQQQRFAANLTELDAQHAARRQAEVAKQKAASAARHDASAASTGRKP